MRASPLGACAAAVLSCLIALTDCSDSQRTPTEPASRSGSTRRVSTSLKLQVSPTELVIVDLQHRATIITMDGKAHWTLGPAELPRVTRVRATPGTVENHSEFAPARRRVFRHESRMAGTATATEAALLESHDGRRSVLREARFSDARPVSQTETRMDSSDGAAQSPPSQSHLS